MKNLSYEQFRAKRVEWIESYEAKNDWAKGLESDFESMTKFAYNLYLKGKTPAFAK